MKFEDDDPARRAVLPYPMELGGQKFDLVEVKQQKDIMLNVARMYAQQEYDRIMEMVGVLQKQAADLKRRLDITDMVHAAEYKFQVYHGQTYWLVRDTTTNKVLLSRLGPNDWSSAAPAAYDYIAQVRWLGDHTWVEVPQGT